MIHEDDAPDTGATIGPPPEPRPAGEGLEHPLRGIVSKWRSLIKKAKKFKKDQFGDDAAEAMRFFNGPYDFLYKRDYREENNLFAPSGDNMDVAGPSFQMTANVVSEMVQIFGPILYFRNPDRVANPRKLPLPPMGTLSSLVGDPNDPQAQQAQQFEQQLMQQMMGQQTKDETRAKFMEWILNYTPVELGLKQHSRLCVDETIIKGASVMWTETYQPKGANNRLVGSFWGSIDELDMDPDAKSRMDIKWSCRTRTRPAWEVEREWGYAPGTLKADLESYEKQAETDADVDGEYNRCRGMTADLITYYEIYSKMGIGGRLKDAPPELKETLEQFGDNCFLVITKQDTPFPLNLPPELLNAPGDQPVDQEGMPTAAPDLPPDPMMMMQQQQQEPQRTVQDEIFSRLEWPTPFWLDDEWPHTVFSFHEVPNQLWPHSHLYPALGYVKLINWVYSFVASKIRITCRDFMAVKASVGDEIIEAILNGKDMTLLKIAEAHQQPIDQLVAFIKHPEMNKDLFAILDMIQHQFEKATGLSELIYGFSEHQFRSAEEARVKGEHLQIRPDDMLDKIEEGQTLLARKEAFAWRWHADPQRDIAPLMGPAGAHYWEQLFSDVDPYEMVTQINYRIEAGSTRKPNREAKAANLDKFGQVFFQPVLQFATETGNTDALNAYMEEWAIANNMDVEKFKFVIPPPPEQQGPTPEQMEVEQMQMQSQMDQQMAMLDAQAKQMELEAKNQELQMAAARGQQELSQDAQSHNQEAQQSDQRFNQEMRQLVLKHSAEMQMMKAKQAMAKQAAAQKAAQKPKPKPRAA